MSDTQPHQPRAEAALAETRDADAVTSEDTMTIARGVDEEIIEPNRRTFDGWALSLVAGLAAAYAIFHMAALNGVSLSAMTGGAVNLPFLPNFPLETWNFRILHIAGALALGFLIFAGGRFPAGPAQETRWVSYVAYALCLPALFALGSALSFAWDIAAGRQWNGIDPGIKSEETWLYGLPLIGATLGGVVLSWVHQRARNGIGAPDVLLGICCAGVAVYLITIFGTTMRNTTGTPFSPIGISFAAIAGIILIMELTRRVTGYALVVIAGVFLAYTFAAPHLPGILNAPPITWERFFGQVYTDAGILGPTTAVSSTYIILFIIFAAFLQASKVGDYFVNFAFAAAGKARGGPAKVSIFASGLMGMINGTSAGNVVATGSLTIPLMKKVGYHPRTAGAVEAAASTGGQIMPPIMGAGAFIMAEITGIAYTDIAVAALIPAILYFAAIYFMVDLEAAKLGMRGMRDDEIPRLKALLAQIYLFIPILILIIALFLGYSVIRAGTLATAAAAVASWLTPHRMGLPQILKAFELAGVMSIQIIGVCACAGIIVGVISLTGVGARFSNFLLELAGVSQLLALVFAMMIAVLLGMGMPTTAAYAVAASVVAPGLVELGIPVLTAHFFVFYFAVVSAITPPVALASYAAAGISGANAMSTSVESFKFGLAAFIVPFMFFYSSAILMQGEAIEIALVLTSALLGVYLLSAAVQGWAFGGRVGVPVRALLGLAALFMISGGLVTDIVGVAIAATAFMVSRVLKPNVDAVVDIRGAD